MDKRGGLSFKGWVILIIVMVFSLFVVQNAMTVDIAFLVWQLTVSRVVLLFGALGVGCFIGFLLGWEVFGRKRKKRAEPAVAQTDGDSRGSFQPPPSTPPSY